MDFDFNKFTLRLKDSLYEIMPYDKNGTHEWKHKNRTRHMRDVALGDNSIISVGLDKQYFEIGNENAEGAYPYYHILNDAQVIRRAGLGTKKSKGSQAFVSDLAKRDYGQVLFTKTKSGSYKPYFEYRRNVRGSRSLVGKATQHTFDEKGNKVYTNKESKYYLNIHYDYINRALPLIVEKLASEFGLKPKRVKENFTEELIDFREQIDNKFLLNNTFFDDIDF